MLPVLAPDALLRAGGPLRVIPGEIHMWGLALEGDAASRAACSALLSGEEQARAARFVYDRHRDAYVFAHGLMRHVLARYAGAAPHGLAFDVGPAGKPSLAGTAGRLSFNFSDSHGRGVLAVGDGRELGVDLELERREVDMLSIAQSYFFRGEIEAIRAAPPERIPEAFFRHWVAKEAVLKGEGMGLGFPLDRFEVAFDAARERARVHSLDPALLRGDWTVRILSLGPGWPVAVAARGEGWRVVPQSLEGA